MGMEGQHLAAGVLGKAQGHGARVQDVEVVGHFAMVEKGFAIVVMAKREAIRGRFNVFIRQILKKQLMLQLCDLGDAKP